MKWSLHHGDCLDRIHEARNETEHANRMMDGVLAMVRAGLVGLALDDIEVARGAAERAATRIRDAEDALLRWKRLQERSE